MKLFKFIIWRVLYSFLIIIGVLLLTFLLFRVAAGDPARTVLGKNPSPQEVESLRMTLSSNKPLVWGKWLQTEIFTSATFAEKRNYIGISQSNECTYKNKALYLNKGELIFKKNFDVPNVIIEGEMLLNGKVKVQLNYQNNLKNKEIVISSNNSFCNQEPRRRLERSDRSATQITIRGMDRKQIIATRRLLVAQRKICATDNHREIEKAVHRTAIKPTCGIKFLDQNTPPPDTIIISSLMNNSFIKSVAFKREQASPWDSQLLASFKEIVSFSSKFPYISFFNFGRTLITRESVKSVLLRGMVPSLTLMIPIFLGEFVLGIIFSLIAVAYRDKITDRVIMILSIGGMSVSYIVFMIFGQWFLAYYYDIFPIWGYGTIKHLILPVSIGIISGLGGGIRFYRTVFINELKKEYLRTATAKGCTAITIYTKHLLRNAAIPLITRATTLLPFLFTGSLLLESFFGIPGLGYAGVNALMNSDLQMVKALVILTAIIFVIMNLFADIAYAWADPRAKKS